MDSVFLSSNLVFLEEYMSLRNVDIDLFFFSITVVKFAKCIVRFLYEIYWHYVQKKNPQIEVPFLP